MVFRSDIYSKFAAQANKRMLSWCVLHGDEGYPKTVGRDLDITCESNKDEKELLSIFKDCLTDNEECKWIIEPDPIWGRRILGISGAFDVAELHIIRPLRAFIMSLRYSRERIKDNHNLFIHDDLLRFFKTYIMPSLNGKNPIELLHWINDDMPWWLKKYSSALMNRNITTYDKIRLFGNYAIAHPMLAFYNLLKWYLIKVTMAKHPATPVFFIDGGINAQEFVTCLRKNLGKIFFDTVYAAGLTKKIVLKLRATQRLVFYQCNDCRIDNFISKELFADKEMLFGFVIDSFYNFHKNRTK